jgi:hypothetical protein
MKHRRHKEYPEPFDSEEDDLPAAPSPYVDSVDYSEDILYLLQRTRRHAPVRRIAEQILHGRRNPLNAVQPLFTALANTDRSRWRERVIAAWAMGSVPMSPNERDAATSMLLEALEDPQQSTLSRAFTRTLGRYVLALAAFSTIVSLFTSQDQWPETALNGFALLLVYTGIFGLGAASGAYMMWQKRVTTLRATAAEALGRIQAVESVGALAGALLDAREPVREAAAIALHDVLPTLTTEHYGVIGGRQTMTNLGKAIGYKDTLLAYKILEALGKVGTSACLPYVEKAAREGRTTRIRDLALEVLDTLQERQRREDEASILVRGSQSPGTSPDLLLRSVREQRVDGSQLLRAELDPSDT